MLRLITCHAGLFLMTYRAESGHWYDQDGNPAYTTVGRNGQERNTTLRDARKNRLVPSVTTILGMAAKPALENWKIDQALLAAATMQQQANEPIEMFMARAKMESRQASKQAAEIGTLIHADIERGFVNGVESVAYNSVRAELDELFPKTVWCSEASFTSPLGFGGKIDLCSLDGVFVDFKTKDGLEGKDAKKLVYDEHGMQLSAYALGSDVDNPVRVSVFVDRADPSITQVYIWDEESHKKHVEMFKALLTYWKLTKNYDPSEDKK
jgi:hypothetical protein